MLYSVFDKEIAMSQTSGNGNYLANQIVSEAQHSGMGGSIPSGRFSVFTKCATPRLVCPDA